MVPCGWRLLIKRSNSSACSDTSISRVARLPPGLERWAAFAELPADFKGRALHRVRTFTEFNQGNDPHNEHDFGMFDLDGQRFLWKIDYYAPDMQHGSEDPNCPASTRRVLTIMLAADY